MMRTAPMKTAGTILVACALSVGCLVGISGCSSGVGAEQSSKNDTVALAQETTRLSDRAGTFYPDVENGYSIPYTVQVEGSTYVDEEGMVYQTAGTEYTVDVSIDPYLLLWRATGTIIDIDYTTDLAVVSLASAEEGHFATKDVLISYANYLAVSEYDLGIGSKISFQYLLSDPTHIPLQAYNVTLA